MSKNPYTQAELYGQCILFAWKYSMESVDTILILRKKDGIVLINWLLLIQTILRSKIHHILGAVFSTLGHNHVGNVIEFDGTNITIQDDSYDDRTNTFTEAKKDWKTLTMPLSSFKQIHGGVKYEININ